jgi:hypothetical protein
LIVRVAFKWTTPNVLRPAINVMHFESIGYNLASLVTSLEARVTAAMWQHAGTDTGISELTLTPLDGSSGSLVQPTTFTAKWKGPQTPGDVVPQAAIIQKLVTSLRGRSFRGRVYLPFPVESAIVNGTYGSAARAAQDTAWGNFIAGMSTDGHSLVVASYKLAAASLVIGHLTESYCGTQRRRQPRPA